MCARVKKLSGHTIATTLFCTVAVALALAGCRTARVAPGTTSASRNATTLTPGAPGVTAGKATSTPGAHTVIPGAASVIPSAAEGSLPDTTFTLTLEGEDCRFADHTDYGIYVPSTAEKIRGIMVFQHGCSQEEFGLSRHHDVQYQAFARKWDLAIIETTIFGLCDVWARPSEGSYKALMLALTKAGVRTGHSELANAPLLVWGHSGGGFWVLSMLHEHPERIIAAIAYSAAWDPQWDYPEAAYEVPILFRHAGPGEGADNIPATARHSFAHLRAHDAPAAIAYTRGQGHNHSYMRTITVPFWEAALQQRLAPDGSLKPIDRDQSYLVDTISFNIYRAADFRGESRGLCLLPDYGSAYAFREFALKGAVRDATPPPAPFDVAIETDGEGNSFLVWRADADLESGIGHFNIYDGDGRLIGRIPEEGLYQDFDRNGDQARPVIPPAMKFRLSGNDRGPFCVQTVNRDGLASEKAVLITPARKS